MNQGKGHRLLPFDRPLDQAIFKERPNRFLGIVDYNGNLVKCHIHDPGRLKELLYPGNKVLITPAKETKGRKTRFDLMFAQHKKHWILVNSSLHRPISQTILLDPKLSPFESLVSLVPEVKYGHGTRFDYMVQLKDGSSCMLEVKGCTLANGDGVALFPDAPTSRGRRHVEELNEIVSSGGKAAILFLVFRPDARAFSPNFKTDPDFSRALLECVKGGVWIFIKKICFQRGWFVYTEEIRLLGGIL
ncbi:sugar fermentation stimulation protein [Dissulfuribacter thermophilus]|uniref:Sugar fermentation stimulation protein homolog n=1 Tax=Dissulfuribacter thermophilus TaxID=1156395 RepID=A0A1B9F7X4_9BACT|nr:DNA/RNA nuclease SfsA [Dissulfuribacter thermophilus]OCC16037.1 sugar fermentation stimulation protein [Dissulfuribacter thermophilus]